MDYRDTPPITGGLAQAAVIDDVDALVDADEDVEDDAGDDDAA